MASSSWPGPARPGQPSPEGAPGERGPGEAGRGPGKPTGARGSRRGPGEGGRAGPGWAGLRRPRAPRCSGPGAARGLCRPCFLVFCPSQRGRCGALFPQPHPFQKKIKKIKNIPLTHRQRETPNAKPASLSPAASPPRETKTRSQ